MDILYGVVGEGMGHATRSRVILEHLLARGHALKVVVSGRAHKFLVDRFAGRERITFEEIHGLHLEYRGNAVGLVESFLANLENAPLGLLRNIDAYRNVAEDRFRPQLVISDFESWAFLYGVNHRLPVVSIDNMQVLARCKHDLEVTAFKSFQFRLAKIAVQLKLPGAYHYLVTSFFFPPVRKKRTTLVPPILRPDVLAAQREPGTHVLVYQTQANNEDLIPVLRALPHAFRVYGFGRDESLGNVTLRAFSEKGFVDDLRTARAVIAGGGYSLMGEAVHLRVPMLSVPIDRQYEQGLNARYLEKLGYGAWAEALDAPAIERFLERTPEFDAALARYPSQDNAKTFECVDELVARVARGDPRPDVLDAPAMGKWEGPPPDTLDLDEDELTGG